MVQVLSEGGRMKKHITSIHDGEKPFHCNHNYSTPQKEHLTTHTESVHQGNKFDCSSCDLTLSDELKLIEHIFYVH